MGTYHQGKWVSIIKNLETIHLENQIARGWHLPRKRIMKVKILFETFQAISWYGYDKQLGKLQIL